MKVASIPCPAVTGTGLTGIWGIDGPETAFPRDRGIAGDPAGFPDADRTAFAETAALVLNTLLDEYLVYRRSVLVPGL